MSNLLALSGGADDGAFGAGLLVGWTAHGDRPEFDLVTGISAGALIAPFAFSAATTTRSSPASSPPTAPTRSTRPTCSGLFGGNSLADSAPLAS